MTAQPQRIEAWTDTEGITLYTCDDGQKHSWVELEVNTIDGTTETVRLTRAQAASLQSEVLDETVPSLRTVWDFERLNRRPASLSSLSRAVSGATSSRKEQATPTPPTIYEQQAARKRRRDRINEAESAVRRAKESAGHYHRHTLVAAELEKQLNQARAVDSGLDLSVMEAEHEKVVGLAALLPAAEAKVTAAEAEVKAAYRWDGYDND